VDEGYNAFFKDKKTVIEGVYGKSEATLYSLQLIISLFLMPKMMI
jgi:hypothetical protein